MEMIQWYPKLGSMICPPKYNYIGEQKESHAICPKCFNAVKGQYTFSNIDGVYGWKLLNDTHDCK